MSQLCSWYCHQQDYLESVVIYQVIVCYSTIIFLWWSCSVVCLKCAGHSIKKCNDNEIPCIAIQSLPVFLKVTFSSLSIHASVPPCSVSVLCAITGCWIQFLKLASLTSPSLKKLNTLMIVCICSAGFYIIFLVFLLLAFKN